MRRADIEFAKKPSEGRENQPPRHGPEGEGSMNKLPSWKMRLFPVQPIKIVRPHRFYFGLCFRKAAQFVQNHDDYRLVHGVCSGFNAHAWALSHDELIVFDGTLQAFFEKDAYYTDQNAIEEKIYSQPEITKLMLASSSWGPWHETRGHIHNGRRYKYSEICRLFAEDEARGFGV
jgi:hypothetical protein